MNQTAVSTIFKLVDTMTKPLKSMSASIGNFQDKIMDVIPGGKALSGMINSVAGQVAIGSLAAKGFSAAWGAVKNTVKSIPEFANAADALGKQSQVLGLNVESLQRFNYAAGMAGVSNEKFAKGLKSLQLKTGGNAAEEIFKLADAVNKETSAAKRAELVNAAMGKTGVDLIPLLADGAEGMRAMMKLAPNVLSSRTVATATVFGDTLTHINGVLKDFGDTAKSGVMSAVLPYVYALKEWLDTNKELVKVKIQEFIQGAIGLMERLRPTVLKIIDTVKNVIDTVKPFAMWVIDNLPRIIPIVTGVVGAFMAFSLVKGVIDGVTKALDGVMKIFSMGPLGVIFLVISALITGFMVLADKVGGVKNAFQLVKIALVAVGQTIMKAVLTPFNLFLTGIVTLLDLLSNIPGVGKLAAGGRDAVSGFQDSMNSLLTGSTSTLWNSGLSAFTDPFASADIGGKYNEMAANVTPKTNDDSGWKAILDKLDGVIAAQEGTTAAVEGSGALVASAAPSLRGDSGKTDFYGTRRNGF
ncbi:hypothetical protein AGMMS49991_04500 [Spirochaetia bacterium]|nr:hypothetical protein AGMMS49991_04500 [Spirochaetia bacterium]